MLEAAVEAVPVPAVAKAVQAEVPKSMPEVLVAAPSETAQAKENQPKPTLWQEMRSTAHVMINQAVSEVGLQITDAQGDTAEIAKVNSDPKNFALWAIYDIRAHQSPGDKISYPNADQQITIVDENGWQRTVVGVENIDGNSFIVGVKDKFNNKPNLLKKLVSRDVLEQAFMLQKLAPHLSGFPESQGKIIQLYLESVKNGKEPASLPENSEKMLLEAAQSAGILTSNDVELSLKQVLPHQEVKLDATASEIAKIKEDNERLDNKRDRLLKPFTDHGIVITEPQRIVNLLDGLGAGATQLLEIRNQFAIEATRLNLLIKANEKQIGKVIKLDGKDVKLTQELYRQWQDDKVRAEESSAASLEVMEMFKKDGPLKQYFDELNAGTLSQELGKQIVESFQNGKIAEPPDVETAADEKAKIKLAEMHKVWKRQDLLSKTRKGTLIAGGSIFGILAAFGFMGMRKEKT